MAGDAVSTVEIACPHCHKTFKPRLIAGASARLRGYKCPHCKLFVPEDRAEDAALARDADR